jgi:hypothetical protein
MAAEFLVHALRTCVPAAFKHLCCALKEEEDEKKKKLVMAEEKESVGGGSVGATAAVSDDATENEVIPRLEDFVEMGPPASSSDDDDANDAAPPDGKKTKCCLALEAMQAALAENGHVHFGDVVAAHGAPTLYQRLLER